MISWHRVAPKSAISAHPKIMRLVLSCCPVSCLFIQWKRVTLMCMQESYSHNILLLDRFYDWESLHVFILHFSIRIITVFLYMLSIKCMKLMHSGDVMPVNMFHVKVWVTCLWAGHSGRAFWGLKCLCPLELWNRGFESH
jgi:dissimilatory sulfite reductase (desulfoviridin) alpha/beta subunit